MKNSHITISNPRTGERSAATLVVMAFSLTTVFGFAALAIDLGRLYLTQAQLQVAASAAAAAAALDLPDGTAAASTAVSIAQANMPVAEHGNILSSSDVLVGHWDEDAGTFTDGGTPVNAVRVTTRRDNSQGNPVGSFFGQLLGISEHELSAGATARQLPALLGAIAAGGDVNITGNVSIDSYDSTEGPYDSGTAGEGGDVHAAGDVTIGGNADIDGDVIGSSVSTGGSSSVSGNTSSSRRSVDYPSVDKSDVENNNDNAGLPLIQNGNKTSSPLDADGNFSLSSNTDYDIPPGVYCFNDLSLGGQSTINTSGLTEIYLTGDLDTSGGNLINASEDPNSLRIFMTGGTAVINASIDWYGLLYAPDTDVTLSGSAGTYGAIIGANVTASGTGDIHFDEGLDLGDIAFNLPKRSSIVQ